MDINIIRNVYRYPFHIYDVTLWISLQLQRVPPPPFVTQYSGFLDGTQYAKGWYAVRKNSVISYADIIFYFKKVRFLSRNTTHVTYKVKQL